MKRLYVAISHHGFGHLAQTAPVLAALHAIRPDVEVLVGSCLPMDVLSQRIRTPFQCHPRITDCNFVMHDSVRLDLPASLQHYASFHADWPDKVAAEATWLEAQSVEAVFSNVGYLPLAGAAKASIPALAMCSLNWADLFQHYLVRTKDVLTRNLHAEMLEAYRHAVVFLRPTPAMPMPDLPNARAIPPIAETGANQPGVVFERLGLKADDRLVIVALGGIPHRLPIEAWPRVPGVKWLVPDAWRASHPDVHSIGATGMAFVDLLASVDALVTKPGYGSFVEAAVHGVPVLYLPRPDWPEAPFLIDWLQHHGRAIELDAGRLARGAFLDLLETLWAMPETGPAEAKGAAQAAAQISALLD